jgi:hypothetical protein
VVSLGVVMLHGYRKPPLKPGAPGPRWRPPGPSGAGFLFSSRAPISHALINLTPTPKTKSGQKLPPELPPFEIVVEPTGEGERVSCWRRMGKNGGRYRIALRCSSASKLAINHSPLVPRSETNLSRISIESGRREENGGRDRWSRINSSGRAGRFGSL